jgi:hypothetical protein
MTEDHTTVLKRIVASLNKHIDEIQAIHDEIESKEEPDADDTELVGIVDAQAKLELVRDDLGGWLPAEEPE